MAQEVKLYRRVHEGTVKVLTSEFLPEYNEQLAKFLKDTKDERHRYIIKNTLNIYSVDGDEITRNNPFANIFMIRRVLPDNLKSPSRGDLERVITKDTKFLESNYVDFGIIVAGDDDSYNINNENLNKRTAGNLVRGLRKMGFSLDINHPKLILNRALKNVRDRSNRVYGLALDIDKEKVTREDIFEANDFNWRSLPKMEGIMRAYLHKEEGWCTSEDWHTGSHLSSLDSDGRIVVIDTKVTQESSQIDTYTTQDVNNLSDAIDMLGEGANPKIIANLKTLRNKLE